MSTQCYYYHQGIIWLINRRRQTLPLEEARDRANELQDRLDLYRAVLSVRLDDPEVIARGLLIPWQNMKMNDVNSAKVLAEQVASLVSDPEKLTVNQQDQLERPIKDDAEGILLVSNYR